MARLLLLLIKEELFEKVGEVLASVLLLAGLELLVALADKSLKDGGADTILVELVSLLLRFDLLAIDKDLLSDLLLGVLA